MSRQLSLFQYMNRRPGPSSQSAAKRRRLETAGDHELHLVSAAACISNSTTSTTTTTTCSTSDSYSTSASCSTVQSFSSAASCSTTQSCSTTDTGGSATVDDIAGSASYSPVQPVHCTFPVTYVSGKARSFNPEWFRQYEWLEHSVHKDAAFCYLCRLFGSPSVCTSRPERAFTQVGFRDWKHATGAKGALMVHHNCLSHKESVIAWQQFKASSKSGSIADQLGTLRAEQIKRNNH